MVIEAAQCTARIMLILTVEIEISSLGYKEYNKQTVKTQGYLEFEAFADVYIDV